MGEAEPDMSWFDIAVTHQGEAVILGHSDGWSDFDIEHWWSDTFDCDEPSHLAAGAYRWSGFKIGSWGEGDHINLIGGEFSPIIPEMSKAETQP
ncbi:hypothetical protein [Sphingobium yanoikuyae]|uniref:Uncharacterized protein n=1 Tax=Sphingobium yanoikuyae TaxID=13690 RepID=A0A0J9D3D1_SPHYA|nr:hypothetical protein [Sphingobium yanoikuyae]ATP19759.1 hypothetical protein BV87_16060 [Sphingobium yanoikuyae]KMW31952.1 hypothetical protein BV87_20875 [Sphingobium yanoikuyae]